MRYTKTEFYLLFSPVLLRYFTEIHLKKTLFCTIFLRYTTMPMRYTIYEYTTIFTIHHNTYEIHNIYEIYQISLLYFAMVQSFLILYFFSWDAPFFFWYIWEVYHNCTVLFTVTPCFCTIIPYYVPYCLHTSQHYLILYYIYYKHHKYTLRLSLTF